MRGAALVLQASSLVRLASAPRARWLAAPRARARGSCATPAMASVAKTLDEVSFISQARHAHVPCLLLLLRPHNTPRAQAQAASIDKELMGPLGFSVDQLMELAGLSCACAISAAYPLPSFTRVLVLAGASASARAVASGSRVGRRRAGQQRWRRPRRGTPPSSLWLCAQRVLPAPHRQAALQRPGDAAGQPGHSVSVGR